MSAPFSPRPLAGLAAAALVVGLVGAPLLAYADPTSTPTPETSAAATPSSERTATPSSEPTTPPQSPSTAADPTEPPSGAESPSGTPSSDESSSPTPETGTDAPSVGDDAVAVPEPTASESSAAESPIQAQAEASASISLAKSATPARVSTVGQVITYRFVAANNGGVELSDVRITDELEGLTDSTCPSTGATLAPGQALTCSAKLTVTQAILDFGDIDNFATVFGSFPIPESPETDYVGANAAARVTVDQSPSLALQASVSPTGTADQGDRLRYRATATNTGNVTLTAARITSSLDALDLDCEPSARATLAPGATLSCAGSYRVTAANARHGQVTNELTARSEAPFGDTGSGGDDVTDDVRLRVAVTEPADDPDADPGLADTGGPGLPIGLAGLVAVAGGLILLRRAQRT